MALSLHSPSSLLTPIQPSKPSSLTLLNCQYSPLTKPTNHITYNDAAVLSNPSPSKKWRVGVSFFPAFLKKGKDAKALKEELLDAIAPLDRGADATLEDQQRVDQIASELEAVNSIKEPLKSDLLNGKWELIYTTSQSILQTQRPKFLRSIANYQAINVDTLRAQNMESFPFFNQVTADLTPLTAKKVAVKFDSFKILGLSIKRRQRKLVHLENDRPILPGSCIMMLESHCRSMIPESQAFFVVGIFLRHSF
eukprot:XP_019079175.1 PREDICTED: probable plastid-lipid-associated protein 4, chloroplastic isoform X1 [Vitis vinifera]